MKRIIAVSGKEIKEIYRNRLFLMLAFVVPFIMFTVFGYGISLDIENMPFTVIDQDKTELSRDIIEAFTGRYFVLKKIVSDEKEAEALLGRGLLRAALVIPPDFTRDVRSGRGGTLQLLIDGGYPYTSLTIKGYGDAIAGKINRKLLKEWENKKGISTSSYPVSVSIRYLFNESLRSSFALIPGLLAIVLLVNPAVLTAISIAREKEFGTIYNIYSTPIRRFEFIVGKSIPYIVISTINLFILLVTIKILFHIPMKGSVINLLPGAFIYILITVSIGLLISSVTKTVVSAQIITLIITTIPAFLYSGLLIPVANLGTEGKVMAHLYPTMYFMEIIHGVYLKKLTLSGLALPVLILLAYGVFLFSLSVFTFRKREG
ncbi:MAG: ABC transporter permease [Nitrospirae bacterium]|nr:MAG: ABC transporter permease [Nitrospirota bacterium]